ETESQRVLYLAVPEETYKSFFQTRLAKIAVERHKVKIIVYNPIMEVIELFSQTKYFLDY
ncbi:MAG: element excision factor XisH family protein, partial [Dolichospermum sp.]